MNPESVLKSPDEKLIAVLGESYLENLLTGKGMKKSSIILSTKRMYFKGTMYGKQGGLFGLTEDTLVPVEDVDSVTIRSFRGAIIASWFFLIMGGINILLSIFFFVDEEIEFGAIELAIGAFSFMVGIALKNLGLNKRLIFTIHGSEKGIPVNWYSESKIDEFISKFTQVSETMRNSRRNVKPAEITKTDEPTDKLEKLFSLFEKGALTKAEFDEQKSRILSSGKTGHTDHPIPD